MIILGIEGGGTRTSALLVDSGTDAVLTSLTLGPGNLHLLTGEALTATDLAQRFTRAKVDKIEELLQTLVTLGQARELPGGKYGG